MFARFIAVVATAVFTAPSASAAIATALPLAAIAAPGGDCAQSPSMSVGPGVLTAGSSATISYSNPGMAGQTITVNIDNGSTRTPQTATVEIVLDANGAGSAVWTVPSWLTAKFNAPGVAEVALAVAR